MISFRRAQSLRTVCSKSVWHLWTSSTAGNSNSSSHSSRLMHHSSKQAMTGTQPSHSQHQVVINNQRQHTAGNSSRRPTATSADCNKTRHSSRVRLVPLTEGLFGQRRDKLLPVLLLQRQTAQRLLQAMQALDTAAVCNSEAQQHHLQGTGSKSPLVADMLLWHLLLHQATGNTVG